MFHFVSCAGALVEETSSGTLVSWKIQIGGFAAPPSPPSAAWDRADAASSRGSAPPRRADRCSGTKGRKEGRRWICFVRFIVFVDWKEPETRLEDVIIM